MSQEAGWSAASRQICKNAVENGNARAEGEKKNAKKKSSKMYRCLLSPYTARKYSKAVSITF